MPNKKLWYDCGELGWSMVIAAHVNLLISEYKSEIAVCTYEDRKCLYNGLNVELVDIPESLTSFFEAADRDGTHLYNQETKEQIGHDVLTSVFREYFESTYEVAAPKDYFYREITRIKPYRYIPLPSAVERVAEKFGDVDSIIIIFPRSRNGKFSKRNLTIDFYKDLTEALDKAFPKSKIVWFGSKKEAYYDPQLEYADLINQEDNCKISDLIALCDSGKVKLAVGSQSAPPKIAAIMGTPTFMIGHEKVRHQVTDNWFKAKVGFWEVGLINDCYTMSKTSIGKCIKEIINFAKV